MSFSREHIFLESFVRRKHLVIEFKPGSKAYKDYGSNSSFSAVYSEAELEELLTNYRASKETFGIVKGEILVGAATAQQK